MVDEGSDDDDDDYDYGQKEDPKKNWKIEKITDTTSSDPAVGLKKAVGSNRQRQLINRKTRGFVVTEMIMNDLKQKTAEAKLRRKRERAEAAAEDGGSDEEQQPKLSGKAKRAEYNANKVKRIGTHYYETANVKNRNRDRVKAVDAELANRGHTKKKPARGK